MKRKITAYFLVIAMALQTSGLSVFAEKLTKTPAESAVTEQNDITRGGTLVKGIDISDLEGASLPDKETGDTAVFNFSAAKYVMSETDGSFEVAVERLGKADKAAEVVFKAVDVLAVYGEDYTILDQDGNPLEQADGIELSPEMTQRLAKAQQADEPQDAVNNGGDDLFEMRNAMLGIDADEAAQTQQTTEDEIQLAMETVTSELFDARGVSGVLHFAAGETQKSFTVVPVNNDIGSADKTVLLALLGTSAGSIAPNATASMMIMDDEPYNPPVFEMAQGSVTLDAENPKAELTIRRTAGEEYYSTVLVSSYSMTAQKDTDFVPLNNHQVVFAPGETARTVTAEAVDFSYAGDFGVRIISDGSCEIGGNDRTIVHIAGEKSEARAPQTQPEEEPISALFAQQTAVRAASAAANEVWDGVLGAKTYVPKELKGTATIRGMGGDKQAVQLRQKIEHADNVQLELGLGSCLANKNIEKINFSYQVERSSYSSPKYQGEFETYVWGESKARDDFSLEFDKAVVRDGLPASSALKDPAKRMSDTLMRYCFNSKKVSYFNMQIDQCEYVFSNPYALKVIDGDKVERVPYYNLNTTGGTVSGHTENYQPPRIKIKTEDGQPIDAFYPTSEMLVFDWGEEELGRHGMFLKSVLISTRELNESEIQLAPSTACAQYKPEEIRRISGFDLLKKLDSIRSDDYTQISSLYVYPKYDVSKIGTLSFRKAEDGSYIHMANNSTFISGVDTGSIIVGNGYAAEGCAITGYAIYGSRYQYDATGSWYTPYELIGVYRNPTDPSMLGGSSLEERFYMPSPPYEIDRAYIVPLTEYQGLTIKPHPSTGKETIFETVIDPETGAETEREVTYGGRIYLNRTFGGGEDTADSVAADENGQIYFDRVNSGSVFTLNALPPNGYITEWLNGTMDFDEDGVIDNQQAGGISQSKVDSLYIPIYGSQFIYQVNQVNPKYYYRFTKFDPSRLLNGQTRVGYVKRDSRTILDYDGSDPSYGDLEPCAGAEVRIGENTATSDENGRYEIKMDGIPDAVRVSAAVRSNNGTFITHIQSNVENNISIPFYDTFEPVGISAAYRGESAVSVRGIKVADNELSVTVKVRHEKDGMYIKDAQFYVLDTDGGLLVDCNEKAQAEDGNYKINYTNDGTYGYATLKMNPKQDMTSGAQLYVRFADQNGTVHRAMNTGYRFIELLDLGTVVFGAIGSSSLEEDVNDASIDLLGSPLLDFDLGQISGFHTSTGLLTPPTQLYDQKGNPVYEYDATLYSYRWGSEGFGNWSGIGGGTPGSGSESGGDSSGTEDTSDYNAQHGELISKIQSGAASSYDGPEDELDSSGANAREPQEPKGADISNGGKSTSVSSEYNFDLSPSIRFDLVTTARPVKDESGKTAYKHYFEEMALGVGLAFEAGARVEITLPVALSIIIKPSLSGSVEGVYYMKTNYGDDKYWDKRPIEYSAGSFGFFKNYDDRMYRAGYLSLNPKIIIDAGVKVAIAEVDVGATFDFDMDFKFDNEETRTYGQLDYEVYINVLILSMKVYGKKLTDGSVHLFGEDEPVGDGGITLMSARMNRAIADAFEDGDYTVEQADRSYVDERGGWDEGGMINPDHPLDRLLQEGVMPSGDMASAMIGNDEMFVAFVDDAGSERSANDRSVVNYTYTDEDGSWIQAKPIEDDGTLDSEPVVYDMGDKLLVAWLSASETFGGAADSLNTVASQLNSLDIHAAFFDKGKKEFGEIFELTKTTELDHTAEGSIVITAQPNGGARIYYTKTNYREMPENVNQLIATSSAIAYRDYTGGEWSEELTPAEQENILASGGDVETYAAKLYGQHFADTRVNGQWKLVTDMEADYKKGAWTYFAYIADEDGRLDTASDRRIFLNLDAYNMPVCVTPEAGAYDDLQFCYSGGELLLLFKTDKAKETVDGEEINMGGISYVNLSEVFEKLNYETLDSGNGYYQMVFAGTDIPYIPENAVVMDGTVQNYTVFADQGGRVYVMWNENTVNDDGTSGVQIYTSVYNGNPAWTQDADQDGSVIDSLWSPPVLMTSPMDGSYSSFTAQSISGDGIAFVAKRTEKDTQTSQMVFHLRAPHAVFVFGEQVIDTKYVYKNQPVQFTAEITNVGLQSEKWELLAQDGGSTWKAQPGNYHILFETVTDGVASEIGSETISNTVWNIGTTLRAVCVWVPETLPDNTDLRITVTDTDNKQEICSMMQPLVKQTELDFGKLEVTAKEKNRAEVTFTLSNSGNIPASPQVNIYALHENGEKTRLHSMYPEQLAPLETTVQTIPLEIPEDCQTIVDGQGKFVLEIEVLEGATVSLRSTAGGSIVYDAEAIQDIQQVEGLNVEKTSLKLKKDETHELQVNLMPAEAFERNRVIYVSSDEAVAYVNAEGKVTAVGNGAATITAYAVPKMEFVSVLSDGSTVVRDMRDMVPDSMIKSQEISVNVSSGGSIGGGGITSYTVTFDTQGGSLINSVRVNKNSMVAKPADPTREGYTFGGWYTDKTCTQAYDFNTKVAQALTLYAKWTEEATRPETWNNPFTDVKSSDWFYDNVQYAYENNLFAGVSDTEFAPNSSMTRAMLVTVLYRAAGQPDMENENWGYPFADVDAESWYGKAVYWARMNSIVKGYSDEEFAPDEKISREQIAAILQRYADFKGITTEEKGDVSVFVDASQISVWARGNVEWAVGAGLISGKGSGRLDPAGSATRAEVAAMLQRFLEK